MNRFIYDRESLKPILNEKTQGSNFLNVQKYLTKQYLVNVKNQIKSSLRKVSYRI